MATAKKVPVKRSAAKKAPAKRAPAQKAPATKSAAAKKVSAPAKTRSRKSKVWDYIRKNTLQDKAKRTMINADTRSKP